MMEDMRGYCVRKQYVVFDGRVRGAKWDVVVGLARGNSIFVEAQVM